MYVSATSDRTHSAINMDLDLSSLGVPRIEVHYANSGRAKCKEFRCRRVIGLGELRCQVNQPGDWSVVILGSTFPHSVRSPAMACRLNSVYCFAIL